jgi:putative ABC transport system permease protein
MRTRVFRDIWQDFVPLGRAIRNTPGFFITCIATVALGISLTTVLLSVVDAVLLRPLAFKDADRLVTIGSVDATFTLPGVPVQTLDVWRASNFEQLETYVESESEVSGLGDPFGAKTTRVSAGLMAMLGAKPLMGRIHGPDDFAGNAPPTAVVSEGFWREKMGADRAVVGRSITLSGVSHIVIGVMPAGYTFHSIAPLIWTPLRPQDTARPTSLIRVIAKLTSPLAATQEWADRRAAQLAAEQPALKYGKIRITPLGKWRANSDVERALWVVLACAGCVLLMACSNAANLTLVRNAARAKDLAVRSALGASRLRLVRQLLVENVALAICAGALGVFLANWLLVLVVPFIPKDVVFGSFFAITLDTRVLIGTLVITLGTGLIFGLIPAVQGAAAGERLASMVGRNSGSERRGGILRATILGSQLAFATLLLAGGGLFGRSFLRVLEVDPGVDVEHVATLSVQPSRVRYPDSTRRRAFYERLESALRDLPGVKSVARAEGAPPHAGFSFGVKVQAEGLASPADQPDILPNFSVDTNYFGVAGTPLVQGRGFVGGDVRSSEPVAVVSSALATWLWGNASVVGKRFRTDDESPWITVVGVAGNASLMGPVEPGASMLGIYEPLRNAPGYTTMLVRTTGNSDALLSSMRNALRAVDPSQPAEFATMADSFADAVARPRFFLWLMAAFGAAALVVAAIGIYGTASFSVKRRSRELAIRMALGATEGSVTAHVMRQTVTIVAVGLAVGLVAAVAAGRLVTSLLFEVHPFDPPSLAVAAVLLGVTALIASYLPAAKVVRAEPFKVIRAD